MAEVSDDWLWHSMIDRICKEQYVNPQFVYKMNFTAFLDWLAYYKMVDEYKQKLQDKANGITRF